MEQTFENWQVSKENIVFDEYAKVAAWCNQSGKYHIEENNEQYEVKLNCQPTKRDENQQKIAELRRQLAQTDYVVIKIAEGCATPQDYAEILIMRQAWRDKINELEEKL